MQHQIRAATRSRRHRLARALASCAIAMAVAHPARGETLQEAMAAALQHYPPLLAEDARRRAAGFGVDVARSGYYPRVTATGDVGANNSGAGFSAGSGALAGSGSGASGDLTSRWGYSLMAEQMLFDGFRTSSSVSEAEAGAFSAEAQRRVTEQLVLMEAVAVYADVLRDREIESLRAADVARLSELVRLTAEQSRLGDSSITDVAQARARRAQAMAELITARASIEARMAEYARVIGRVPSNLVRPRLPDEGLPKTLEETVASAQAAHPLAEVAEHREAASRFAVDRTRADGLPQVKLRGGVEGDRAINSATAGRDAASVSVRVVVPVLDGGETSAKVRQAREINRGLAEDARAVRDRLKSGAVAAWAGLDAARQRIKAERDAVAESRRAADGIQQEIKAGNRTTLELLDAQKELVNAQVRVATGERELIVASYTLLAAMGQLNAGAAAIAVRGRTSAPVGKGDGKSGSKVNGWQVRTIERQEPASSSGKAK